MVKKLIASDLDGTLLPYGHKEIDPEAFNVIHDLQKKGALFIPASGRNIHSIRKLFKPINNELSYLSENGAVVWYKNEEIADFPLPKRLIDPISDAIFKDPNLDLYLTSATKGYLVTDDDERKVVATKRFGEYDHKVIDSDTWDIKDDRVVKICALMHDSKQTKEYFDKFDKEFGDEINTAMAGLDVVNFALGSKGHGLRILSRYLGVDPSEVYAFGDNYNDFPMLEFAGESYMMQTDDPNKIKAAKYLCNNVVDELKKIYKQM